MSFIRIFVCVALALSATGVRAAISVAGTNRVLALPPDCRTALEEIVRKVAPSENGATAVGYLDEWESLMEGAGYPRPARASILRMIDFFEKQDWHDDRLLATQKVLKEVRGSSSGHGPFLNLLSSDLGIHSGKSSGDFVTQGLHWWSWDGFFNVSFTKHPQPDWSYSAAPFRPFEAKKVKTVITLRHVDVLNGGKVDWTSNFLHEVTHEADAHRTVAWINANLNRIRKGLEPDWLFKDVVRIRDGDLEVDSDFLTSYTESRAYFVGTVVKLANGTDPREREKREDRERERGYSATVDAIGADAARRLGLTEPDFFNYGGHIGQIMDHTIAAGDGPLSAKSQ